MRFTVEVIALVVCLAFVWRYLGSYMAAVFDGRVHWMGWLERPTYRLLGVDPESEQTWQRYAVSLIIYSGVAVLVVYGFERLQGSLPLNPQHFGAVGPALSLQHRDVVRDEHELAELRRRVDDVLPHADGRPRRPAVRQRGGRHGRHGRADPRLRAEELDHDRQLLGRPHPRHALHPAPDRRSWPRSSTSARAPCRHSPDRSHIHDALNGVSQIIPRGPHGSMTSIKQLGNNGGGFTNANGAHPFENPTAFTQWLSICCCSFDPGRPAPTCSARW